MTKTTRFLKTQRHNYVYYIAVLFAFLISGCTEKNTTPVPELSFELSLNETQIFAVREVNYAINDEPALSDYFIKETVVAIEENVNEKTYTIERYHRIRESDQWRIERAYKLKQTPAELIEIGELPLVRLTFPVIENTAFNVNKYNRQANLSATYTAVNQPFESSPATYSVYQANDSTLINLNRVFSVYSTTEGLIYQENTNVDYCQSSPECIGTGEVAFGKRIIWRRIN